jgi:Zn-dependent protease
MLIFPGRIPVAIHPFFWIFAALIGWLNSRSLIGTLIWVGIIFISVLFHEFGHALTAVCFRQKASIQLVAFGGFTAYDGSKLALWKQFFITLNGPLFGFGIYLLATLILQANWTGMPVIFTILRWTQLANLFWTLVNLLPVMPLDGGHLLRIIFEAVFGLKGIRAALLVGAVLSLGLALYFMVAQAFLVGAFFFLFAFQGFDSWRKSRLSTADDQEEGNKELIKKAEIALQMGHLGEAKRCFEEVINHSKQGILRLSASQYLAFIYMKEGKRLEAYEVLLPIKDHVSDESRCLLHLLAAEQKNDELVAALSTDCYQVAPSVEMALRNARAFANLKQAKFAGGWLQTALQEGEFDLKALLGEEAFQAIKEDPEFRAFINPLQ